MPSPATTPPARAHAPVPGPGAPAPGTPIGAHYEHCYGCGPLNPGGLHMTAVAGEGVSLTARFTVAEQHQGAPGLAHGGVLSAAFDEVLGMLVWLLRTPAVTGRLETDFRLPVPVGTDLQLAARCTGVDGRKFYTEAQARLGVDGPVAARAAALFIAVPVSHFSEHGWGVPDSVRRGGAEPPSYGP